MILNPKKNGVEITNKDSDAVYKIQSQRFQKLNDIPQDESVAATMALTLLVRRCLVKPYRGPACRGPIFTAESSEERSFNRRRTCVEILR